MSLFKQHSRKLKSFEIRKIIQEEGIMATVRCPLGHPYDNSVYSECPYCKSLEDHSSGGTSTGDGYSAETVPLSSLSAETNRTEGETVIFNSKKGRNDPVVGWLVCSNGVEKGKDYRIHFGQNSVGRDNNMDIVLKDNGISRAGHCFITYDYKHNSFVIHSGISHGVIYKNGELVAGVASLVAFDVLELGESKFIFVPFCGENFKWEQEDEKHL
jgi:hypothetical protein